MRHDFSGFLHLSPQNNSSAARVGPRALCRRRVRVVGEWIAALAGSALLAERRAGSTTCRVRARAKSPPHDNPDAGSLVRSRRGVA